MRPGIRQVALVVSALAALVALAALGVFLWLRTYAPLTAMRPATPGASLAADVEPTFGSGGKTVFVPAYRQSRTFDTTVTIRNRGRFSITLLGVEDGSGPLSPSGIAGPADVRLSPHDSGLVTIRWRLRCGKATPATSADTVRLRYRYLSSFTRTQAVVLPFAVTLRCPGGSRPSP
jgi:hypothetical protein